MLTAVEDRALEHGRNWLHPFGTSSATTSRSPSSWPASRKQSQISSTKTSPPSSAALTTSNSAMSPNQTFDTHSPLPSPTQEQLRVGTERHGIRIVPADFGVEATVLLIHEAASVHEVLDII
jgi:hypothetical protein